MDGPPPVGLLFTDQYQLTMAQLYYREGMAGQTAAFDYFFRSYPDYTTGRAGFCVFAGLGPLLEWMAQAEATPADVEYLRSLRASTGGPRFDAGFLAWIEQEASFSQLRVESVAEGRVVHPHEPVLTVEGPLAVAQILETVLLNHLNYPTLIATKATRVGMAAGVGPVLEFGLRRGPVSGSNDGTRAALIGGADFTSNVAMSAALGLDPKGTHAHSMVQAFMAAGGDEIDAFRAYAASYPDDCLLLIDTVDTLESGLPNALTVFAELRARGHEPVGVRLDSGDLAVLAVETARRLDRAGFGDTQIVLSSDLDEFEIASVRRRIASYGPSSGVDPAALERRLVYGVGTRLIASHGDPALSGVYKLAALDVEGTWEPAAKRSDTAVKMTLPGRKSVWRAHDGSGTSLFDIVGLAGEDPPDIAGVEFAALRSTVFDGAERIATQSLEALRANRQADVDALPENLKRLVDPAAYEVRIGEKLAALASRLGVAPAVGHEL